MFWNQIFLIIGLILFVVGLGFSLRFLAYMIRGTGMTALAFLQLTIFGGVALGVGFYLLILNWSIIRGGIL